MALFKALRRLGAGYAQVAPTDQIACDAGAMTITPTGGTSLSLPDAIAGRARIGRSIVANAAYTAVAQDVYIGISSITASRTLTLPAAASFPPGQPLYIADETGLLSNALVLTIQRAGTDTIAGLTSIDMMSPYQKLVLHSNGSNLWTY